MSRLTIAWAAAALAAVALLGATPAALADSSTGTITGTVIDASSGQPVAGAAVSTQDPSTNSWISVNTDSSGDFTLSGLAPDTYTLTAADYPDYNPASTAPMTVSAGQTVSGVTIAMQPAMGNLTGRVTDASGAPLAGMQVQLTDSSGATPQAASAFSDDSGTYTMTAVPTGTYTVTVSDGTPYTAAPPAPIQLGSVTLSGGTATDNLQVPAPKLPAGTVARNAQRDLAWLNAERIANGLPGGIVLNPRWSADCAAHDNYERENGGTLSHPEALGQPGSTPDGNWVGQTSVLARAAWAAGANPFETAPIHLDQLYSPSITVMGIDDSGPGGFQCATTWTGMQAIFPTDTVFTYPGNGVAGVPPSENAAEDPFVPGKFVGIPQGTTAGRELFVYLNQAGVMGQAQVQFTSATLTGPQGPVAIKTVDNSTPTLGPYLAGGIIIPVKPLAPLTTYTASVTLVNGSGTISHTWSFRTGNASAPTPGGSSAGCVVPKLRRMSLNKARRALRHAQCRLGKVRKPKHPARHHALRVARQSLRAGSRRPAGTKVNLVLR